ncbi:hypothetical protein [Carboxylicivirga marina]|uniref:hypothetical protein n=1 Tax=Carboxylicivirga marina TaxID=2800988 RepID=UPI002598CA2F|nr:hypothetical protein [uncultured Carboxylicivirga sp.]
MKLTQLIISLCIIVILSSCDERAINVLLKAQCEVVYISELQIVNSGYATMEVTVRNKGTWAAENIAVVAQMVRDGQVIEIQKASIDYLSLKTSETVILVFKCGCYEYDSVDIELSWNEAEKVG